MPRQKPANADAPKPVSAKAAQVAPEPPKNPEAAPSRDYLDTGPEVETDGILGPKERKAARRRGGLIDHQSSDSTPEEPPVQKRTYDYGDDPSIDEETPAPEATDDDTAADADTQEPQAADDGDDLAAKAAKYGLDPNDFTTPKALKSLLDRMEHSESVYLQQMEAGRQTPAETRQQDQQAPPQLPEFDLGGLDEFDPKLVEKLQGMNKHYAAQTAQLRQALMAFHQQAQEREAGAFETRFDNWIKGLGEEWKDTFGTGRGRAMDNRTKGYKNRVKVLRAMQAIQHSHADSPSDTPDEDAMRDQALRLVFTDKMDQLAKKKLAATVTKRSASIIQRPTSRIGAPAKNGMTGDEKARAFAGDFMRRKGFI